MAVVGLIVLLAVRGLADAKAKVDTRFRFLSDGLGVFIVPLSIVFLFLVIADVLEVV